MQYLLVGATMTAIHHEFGIRRLSLIHIYKIMDDAIAAWEEQDGNTQPQMQ